MKLCMKPDYLHQEMSLKSASEGLKTCGWKTEKIIVYKLREVTLSDLCSLLLIILEVSKLRRHLHKLLITRIYCQNLGDKVSLWVVVEDRFHTQASEVELYDVLVSNQGIVYNIVCGEAVGAQV